LCERHGLRPRGALDGSGQGLLGLFKREHGEHRWRATRVTVADLARSAQCPRRKLFRQWAQAVGMNEVCLGHWGRRFRLAARSRDEGFRRWQPGDSKESALERQPGTSRRTRFASDGSRRHRAWRKLLRRWRPDDSMKFVSCDDPAPSVERLPDPETKGFRRWQPRDSWNGALQWQPSASVRKRYRLGTESLLRLGRESPFASVAGGRA
jgi:hypothetical protein